ncbi:hypothetical protein WBG78_16430 [Chryseolinea sp. T2]|uniref:hypothetical protein n=1 Tax=Chryseolinea sp. T2 TaxID=3129255 RepID=UPI003078092C
MLTAFNTSLKFRYSLTFRIKLSILVMTFCLAGCKKESTSDNELNDSLASAGTDTTGIVEDDDMIAQNDGPAALWPRAIIAYDGPVDNEVRKLLVSFLPLQKVLDASEKSVALKDSLEMTHLDADGGPAPILTEPSDSAIFRPVEIAAWQAIQNYKKWIEAGSPAKDACPSLLELERLQGDDDKSVSYLPEPGASKYLANGKFFFLGGAPFIEEVVTEDGTPFTDPNGKPEKHYTSVLSENGRYFFNSLYHFKNVPVKLDFGKPLRSYEMGPQEVNGVGSLIHRFVNPITVSFLTDEGVVPARLISVEVKLVAESLGCVSDQPLYTFACDKPIDPMNILGVYVSYSSSHTGYKLVRHSAGVWTIDLNGDGIADLGCVSGAFEGIASDTMAEVLWYVNNNGKWQVLDYSSELDCT